MIHLYVMYPTILLNECAVPTMRRLPFGMAWMIVILDSSLHNYEPSPIV